MLVKPASITGNGVIFETSFDGKRAVKIWMQCLLNSHHRWANACHIFGLGHPIATGITRLLLLSVTKVRKYCVSKARVGLRGGMTQKIDIESWAVMFLLYSTRDRFWASKVNRDVVIRNKRVMATNILIVFRPAC
jgi:hypothetical protein